MAFEICPKCEAPTTYRGSGDDRSLVCTRCNWEAVGIEWTAKAVRYDKRLKRLEN